MSASAGEEGLAALGAEGLRRKDLSTAAEGLAEAPPVDDERRLAEEGLLLDEAIAPVTIRGGVHRAEFHGSVLYAIQSPAAAKSLPR